MSYPATSEETSGAFARREWTVYGALAFYLVGAAACLLWEYHLARSEFAHGEEAGANAPEPAAERREEYLVAGFGAILLILAGGASFYLYRSAQKARREMAARAELIEQLRQAEKKYRSIFDNASEGIFQATPEGQFLTANRALARMYGYESPEHLIESLAETGHAALPGA